MKTRSVSARAWQQKPHQSSFPLAFSTHVPPALTLAPRYDGNVICRTIIRRGSPPDGIHRRAVVPEGDRQGLRQGFERGWQRYSLPQVELRPGRSTEAPPSHSTGRPGGIAGSTSERCLMDQNRLFRRSLDVLSPAGASARSGSLPPPQRRGRRAVAWLR